MLGQCEGRRRISCCRDYSGGKSVRRATPSRLCELGTDSKPHSGPLVSLNRRPARTSGVTFRRSSPRCRRLQRIGRGCLARFCLCNGLLEPSEPFQPLCLCPENSVSRNDLETLEYVSRRLGKTRIEVARQGEVGPEQAQAGLSGRNSSMELHDLLTPDEISRHFSRSDRLKRQLVIWAGYDPMVGISIMVGRIGPCSRGPAF
jgi:hypothetical protein